MTSNDGPAPEPPVEIRRSRRRRRTVSARMEGGTLVVLMPAGLSSRRERELVDDMRLRVLRAESRRRAGTAGGDAELLARARTLSARWLDGVEQPVSVYWVSTMTTRWASCTQLDGSIRVSDALRDVPAYVLDYVLVHELVHLSIVGHGEDFWTRCGRYPRTERARGYLEALARERGRPDVTD